MNPHHVDTFGDPADPAILLIHGAGNTMLSWDEELCARLAAGPRFVIRYDCRPANAMRELVAEAVGVLDIYGVPSAHVVGMSLGGGIAQVLALEHPDRVASLTLASATPGGPGHSQRDLPGMAPALAAFYADEPPEPDWSDRAAVVDYLVEAERPFAPEFDEPAARELAGRVFDQTPELEARLTGGVEFDAGEPWRQRLGEIRVPTLVVHGADDPLFPPAHAHAMAREIPGAELLIFERMGHEYFPRRTWDVVVPALLRHTSGYRRAATSSSMASAASGRPQSSSEAGAGTL